MFKYVTLISYWGGDYCGWQKQKGSAAEGKDSIQLTLEKALHRITGEEVSWVGSGRTDSGVHALGQVAHFRLKTREWDTGVLQRGLNGLLPMSIRILAVQRIAEDFHSQKSATQKQYSYYFQQGPCALSHLEPFSWWIRKELDLAAMSTAVRSLVGEHDYKPFQASGAKPGPTVRKILEAEVTLEPIPFPIGVLPLQFKETQRFGLVRVRVVGTGFLKQMVRGIAGTLLQVGERRRPATCMSEILETQDRLKVGPTAPARALWLEKVWYPEVFQLEW